MTRNLQERHAGIAGLQESPLPGLYLSPTDPLGHLIAKDAITYEDTRKDSNPKDAAASGRVPMHMVPDTLALYAAMGFAEGDSKYIAYNFRVAGIRVTVYVSALRRHLMKYFNGEWADKKTGIPHLASVAACTSILIDGHVTGLLQDDRPPAVDLGDEIEEAERIIAHVYNLNEATRAKAPVKEYTALNTGSQLPVARPHIAALLKAPA